MIRLFVEGKWDSDFVEKYLIHLLRESAGRWEIIPTGGYTNLPFIDQKFKENSDNGGINLVLFDADFPKTSDGGYVARKKYIEEKMKELSIVGEVFLFPNNKDDGDFELMLEHIINEEHRCLLGCFEGYERCVGGYRDDRGNPKYVTPNRKSKIYAYVEAFKKKSRKEKEQFKSGELFFNDSNYWNLEAEYLAPLKNFLQRVIV